MLYKKLIRTETVVFTMKYSLGKKEGAVAINLAKEDALNFLSPMKLKFTDERFYGKKLKMKFKCEYQVFSDGLKKLRRLGASVEDVTNLGRLMWDTPRS